MTSNLNTYTFPDAEIVLNKLIAAAVLPESDFLRVLGKFAATIGGKSKVAGGVAMAFYLAIHDVTSLPGAVPFVGAMLDTEFDDLMTAIIDDADFLNEVIHLHAEVAGRT